MFNALINL